MCCFSGPVGAVTSTRIFARPSGGPKQIVVYQMNVQAPSDVAMILPLPVADGATENSIRFISLQDYPDFFVDLNQGWREYDAPVPGALSIGGAPALAVHDVGDFEASFAPSLADLARLDERFQIPPVAWQAVPDVDNRGFAVFKLRGLSPKTSTTPHPMAFEFARRDTASLCFPTLHIHDGEFHPTARFDHVLYAQTGRKEDPHMDGPAGDEYCEEDDAVEHCVDLVRAAGTVQPGATVYRQIRFGEHPNADITLTLAGSDR